jgi:hypothetical protein
MKYMLQVRFNGADLALRNLSLREQEAITAEFEALSQSGDVLDGNQLQPLSTARTVRVHAGQTQVSNGSAVDPSTALDGYYLCHASDFSGAIALAARIPLTRLGASVEVRPVVER